MILLQKKGNFIPTKVYRAHSDLILRTVMSSDEKVVATCSADRTVRLFGLGVSEDGVKFESKKTLVGHTKWVWDAAFNIEADFLLTCSTDATVKIWNVEQGEAIRNLKSQRLGVTCMTFNDSIIKRDCPFTSNPHQSFPIASWY